MSPAPDRAVGEPRPPARESSARLGRLFGYTRPYTLRLGLALACLAAGSLLGLVYPAFFGRVIDAAFTHRDLSALNRHTALLVAVFLVQAVFVFFRHYLMTWVGERVVTDLRVQIYGHLVRMPQGWFHRKRTGELLSRLSDDVTRLQGMVGEDLSVALRNLVTLVGGIAVLFWTQPLLTAAMLAVVPPLVVGAVAWGRIIRRLSRAAQDELARAGGDLEESLAGIETVQAFTRESWELRRYSDSMGRVFALFVHRAKARSWFGAVSTFVAFAAIAGIFWLGGRMVARGEITAGDLTEFLLYTMLVAGAVGNIAALWGSLQSTLGATTRVFEILDEPPAIADLAGAVDVPRPVEGRIEFVDVAFAYDDREHEVVRGVSFVARPGTTVAVVGASGSGKTTLARLVLRAWDPTSGRVLLDGRDLRGLRLASLRGCMALVSQDPMLFSGTIRENIRYGRLEATDAQVEAAAEAAHAAEFIRGFPQGYDTIVGERGVMLSGGQRQRVSIARAILRDPRVLILDEATSALDAESEHLVQAALEGLQRGRTTLVIAHRLSTIRGADEILVLDEGRIVERGRHDDLLAAGGAYARLVARQAAGRHGEATASGAA